MAKQVDKAKQIEAIESDLNPTSNFVILFEGNEVEVSGDVANILIKKGKATLVK